ncbi:hypothetical protein FHT86_007152 [Rhizobium sp. BK313]|nr:TraH family protein [Rhizobium sp. BK313]MBB3458826.1 hypothetical protein [Rhizobium sp. BK313]
MDAALLAKCADPSLSKAIVEQFVAAVGSVDPLAVTVTVDGRLVLVPKPKSPDEALAIVREYLGSGAVRVGITQFPAGVGLKDASQLQPGLVDACENLRMGTAMFGRVLRIVSNWYGRPRNNDALPQILDDAFDAWRTGYFEGKSVFRAQDPEGSVFQPSDATAKSADASKDEQPSPEPWTSKSVLDNAGIRIDLSRIDGEK